MSAQYEKTLATTVSVTSTPTTADAMANAEFLDLAASIKQATFTAGQKQDVDVTTLGSTEQEMINGLAAASEISFSGNFYRNAAQDTLRIAYDTDGIYGFKIVFPSGAGFSFLAEVRQHTWDAQANGVVAATFSLRLKGKLTNINNAKPLSLTTNLPPTMAIPVNSELKLEVKAEGGSAPYSYKWFKDGAELAGQITPVFAKASAAATDAGAYKCTVTDAAATAASVTSDTCTVTVEA